MAPFTAAAGHPHAGPPAFLVRRLAFGARAATGDDTAEALRTSEGRKAMIEVTTSLGQDDNFGLQVEGERSRLSEEGCGLPPRSPLLTRVRAQLRGAFTRYGDVG